MKRIVVCLLSVLLLAVLMPCLFVLYELFLEIRPGMTRAELLTICRTEGGISWPMHGHFIYRRFQPPNYCKHWRFIKVDVDFEAVEPKSDHAERPTDKIIKVSMPYLEFETYD